VLAKPKKQTKKFKLKVCLSCHKAQMKVRLSNLSIKVSVGRKRSLNSLRWQRRSNQVYAHRSRYCMRPRNLGPAKSPTIFEFFPETTSGT